MRIPGMQKVIQVAKISANDVFLDLGSGTHPYYHDAPTKNMTRTFFRYLTLFTFLGELRLFKHDGRRFEKHFLLFDNTVVLIYYIMKTLYTMLSSFLI